LRRAASITSRFAPRVSLPSASGAGLRMLWRRAEN